MGVMDEMPRGGGVAVATLNHGAGFSIHPFELAGVAVPVSAGVRDAPRPLAVYLIACGRRPDPADNRTLSMVPEALWFFCVRKALEETCVPRII